MEKLSPPKGTRDFGATELAKRYFIVNHIRRVFELYGYTPLETPAMEYTETLTGKYGDEGDQLIFRVLNSGNFLEGVSEEEIAAGAKKLQNRICEKSLRYDLTIPFARYVSQNRGKLILPFKRYQIQPVWRADRPQKGRYREFYQCDADVIGTDSLICEAEIIGMITDVFAALNIADYSIHINHRQLLTAWAGKLGFEGTESAFLVAIDKLDKIGWAGVFNELSSRSLPEHAIEQLKHFAEKATDYTDHLKLFTSLLSGDPVGEVAIKELEQIIIMAGALGKPVDKVKFDFTLARGLNYYTGAIFEVKIHNTGLGSVSGGGRYSDLTAAFGFPGTSGVGFSFGLDRLFDAMETLKLFPESLQQSTKVLVTYFDEATLSYSLNILSALRASGISAEIYPTPDKLKKQLTYADKKNIPFIIVAGQEEKQKGLYKLKNMLSGEQNEHSIETIIQKLS
jgi:histidyl-tRNA synthetase